MRFDALLLGKYFTDIITSTFGHFFRLHRRFVGLEWDSKRRRK